MKVTLYDAGAYSFYEISLLVNEMFTDQDSVVAKHGTITSKGITSQQCRREATSVFPLPAHRARICGNPPSLLIKPAKVNK
ncbi:MULTISPECIES: hypothetical protein [Pectobacterium]|uniref:Uncharacterized protein n=1 Tax=Pectobacterium punjabense TaxID=2108399 RepID=A0ABX6L233_9GAMM|nr:MULTISPECIES: hypothetical protein [Pectobacterium]GKW11582.1 hypothetical protein PEC301899_18640 [Pectobacterium carotovorum subsp. carotovorum]MBN3137133.1 hypothetical protein [Pectobacterium punjabense]MBS4432451.1 hypothetical protein [Pectobacterium punjabense]MBT9185886.1 hypothetical protein [Pectobacterium punjabense]MCE5379041.1 hypothetical protein [Pectobacterium punjabense]